MDSDQRISEDLKRIGIKTNKREQQLILNCLTEKKGCVAVLPTGFGKSLSFTSEESLGRRQVLGESYCVVSPCVVNAGQGQQTKFSWIGYSSFQIFV